MDPIPSDEWRPRSARKRPRVRPFKIEVRYIRPDGRVGPWRRWAAYEDWRMHHERARFFGFASRDLPASMTS